MDSTTYFSDNRHEDFEEKVKNEDENKMFHHVHNIYSDPEVLLQ